MKNKIAIFSFFSGLGFLDLGFESAGFSTVYVNESHKPFLEGYKYAREKMKIPPPDCGYFAGDIADCLDGDEADKLDKCFLNSQKEYKYVGFIGGPPCPDFSIGGKNLGEHGDNGKLSETYVQLICMEHPDFFLFENVKGLWSTKKHRNFYNQLKKKLIRSGYVVSDRLSNSIEYGVPQDRWRVFLFGVKRYLAAEIGLEIDRKKGTILDFPWQKYSVYKNDVAFGLPWPTKSKFAINSKARKPRNLPYDLTVNYWFKKNKVDNHPNANHHFQPKAALPKFQTIDEGDSSKKSFKRLHRWRYSPTACYGNNEVHLHPYKARRISAAEALAIQSLPRDFELPPNMTLTDMFKSIGNGVPFLLSNAIAKTIQGVING